MVSYVTIHCRFELHGHVVFLHDIQSALWKTLAILLLKLERAKDVQTYLGTDLGSAYPSPTVWSASMELLKCLWQATSVMLILI